MIWLKKICLLGRKFFLDVIIGRVLIRFFYNNEKVSKYCSNKKAENLLRQKFRKLIKSEDYTNVTFLDN